MVVLKDMEAPNYQTGALTYSRTQNFDTSLTEVVLAGASNDAYAPLSKIPTPDST